MRAAFDVPENLAGLVWIVLQPGGDRVTAEWQRATELNGELVVPIGRRVVARALRGLADQLDATAALLEEDET